MKKIVLVIALMFAVPVMAVDGIVLKYLVQEPGVEAYQSRVLVTAAYMRMDEGGDSDNFVLFDRKQRTIYSVTHDDETVFVIPERPVAIESPDPIARSDNQLETDASMPTVAGHTLSHHQLLVNAKPCQEVVAARGLLSGAVEAISEFRTVLAGEHARILPSIPADVRDPCDLALNIFAPTWQMSFGLPVQIWNEGGDSQALVDFNPAAQLDETLFVLPEGYKRYSTE